LVGRKCSDPELLGLFCDRVENGHHGIIPKHNGRVYRKLGGHPSSAPLPQGKKVLRLLGAKVRTA
jgi:hypothetical protein